MAIEFLQYPASCSLAQSPIVCAVSESVSGSIASWNIVVKNRQVVYSPRRDYLGEDVFR